MFLREFVIYAGCGRRRPVSMRTSTVYKDVLHQVIGELKLVRMPVTDLSVIGQKHVLCLTKHWIKEGHAPATIQGKVSVLRRFLTMVGKPNAIPRANEWRELLNKNSIEVPDRRTTVAIRSKAWDELGVDFKEILERVGRRCPLTAMQLEMQVAFGLRMREALQMDPKAADCGNMLRVIYGTKGGRPRDVYFDADEGMSLWQRDVLERAKVYALKHPKGRLARKGYKLEQNVRHFYHEMEAVGVSKSALGVTPHGLRHQYAARRYFEYTGMAPPVSKDAKLQFTAQDLDADYQARAKVTQDLGHDRRDIPKHYLGSHQMLDRDKKRRIGEWIGMTEKNAEFQKACAQAGVKQIWLTGHFALGIDVHKDERFELTARFVSIEAAQANRQQLMKVLADMYLRGANVIPWVLNDSPDPAIEIWLDEAQGLSTQAQLV